MRRSLLTLLAVALGLGLLVTACGSKGTTTASSESSTTVPETTVVPSVDPATFATGLSWFFADSSGTTPAVLSSTIAPCTLTNLSNADAVIVAGFKSASDSDKLADSVGIRVFQAGISCDRATVQALFVQQAKLDQLGASAAQQSCVTPELMDKIAALDDSKATGTGGEAMSVPFGAAMDTCGISLEKGLATILAEPSSGIPAASVDCIASAASKALTWSQVVDKANQDAVKSAMQAAAAGCTH